MYKKAQEKYKEDLKTIDTINDPKLRTLLRQIAEQNLKENKINNVLDKKLDEGEENLEDLQIEYKHNKTQLTNNHKLGITISIMILVIISILLLF